MDLHSQHSTHGHNTWEVMGATRVMKMVQ